jgi:outer membrane immunogenic protein
MNQKREQSGAMKNFLLASTAILCSGTAFGSDLPPRVSSKAAMAYAAAPAPFSWTGCYAGAHAGAGWSRTNFSDPNPGIIAPLGQLVDVKSGAGLLGGGQIGCDYQFASHWVAGLAGDFSWANIQGQTDDPFFGGKNTGSALTLHSRTDFFASTTGRIGYAWDRYLVYAKGGVAWSHNNYDANNFFCGIFIGGCYANASDTQIGWTAGGGIEWGFTPNWSVLAEYDHYGFGTKNLTFFDTVHGFTFVFGVKQDIDVVKVGINYRFGGLLR